MKIINFEKKYFEQVLQIEEKVFSDAWSKEMFLLELSVKNGIFYLCLDEERVVAYLIARQILDEVEILNLAVDIDFRRRSLGETLIKKLLNSLDDIRLYSLEVRESNLPAISLYKKYGFERVGTRKDYYENPKEMAIVMIRMEK